MVMRFSCQFQKQPNYVLMAATSKLMGEFRDLLDTHANRLIFTGCDFQECLDVSNQLFFRSFLHAPQLSLLASKGQ